MRAHDWRAATPDLTSGLFAAEAARWRERLAWDTEPVWARVEAARRAGALPGLLVSDDAGRVHGWSFHLVHEDVLQIGALVADSPQATAAWLRGLAATPEAATAARCLCFGWFDAPGLDAALRAAGLQVQPYAYLHCDLHDRDDSICAKSAGDLVGRPDRSCLTRPWRAADATGVAALLAEAYPGADETRPFAPSGTPAAWRAYLGQLVDADATGAFEAALSLVAEGSGGAIDAVALVTRLAPRTAHLVQIAVRPGRHRRGLGRTLLAQARHGARAAGCDVLTLLVAERNAAARALYARSGFTDRATFLSATGTSEFRIRHSESTGVGPACVSSPPKRQA